MKALKTISELFSKNSGYKHRMFRFTLSNATEGTLVLRHVPDGWKDGELSFTRSEKYKGVFRKYSTNTLMFPKEGRDYIRNVYELQGPSAEIGLLIEIFNNELFQYDELFVGKIDLGTYDIHEIGTTEQIIDDSFTEKVRSRDEVSLDLYNLKTVENGSITPFSIENLTIDLPEYHINDTVIWDESSVNEIVANNYIIPLKIVKSNLSEASSVEVGTPLTIDSAYVRNLTVNSYRLRGTINGNMSMNGAAPYIVQLVLRRIKADGTFTTTIIDTDIKTSTAFVWDYSFDITVTLTDAPESHILYILVNNTINVAQTFNADVRYDKVIEQIDIKAMPIYECFLRAVQKITGNANPVYSSKFGRTDSMLTTYPTDGELISLTTGTSIRDANTGTLDTKLNVTLAELFDSMNSIMPISLSIETISGVQKVRIEDLDYVYDANVILDLSDRIREASIRKQVIPDMHYNSIEAGYSNSESDNANGLYEFNRKSSWSTVLNNFKSILSLINPFSASTVSIVKLRDIKAEDKDSIEEDDSVYLIDLHRNGVNDFVVRTQEDISTGGAEFDADETYNQRLTPARTVKRWYKHIHASLIRNVGSWIPKMTNTGYQAFTTKITGELDFLAESNTFSINPILWYYEKPRYYAEKYIVECPFYAADVAKIDVNPRGLIKLSDTKYGWILDVNTNLRNKKAYLELLRCNLDAVTPINPKSDDYYYYFDGSDGALSELTDKTVTNTDVTLEANGSNTVGRWGLSTSVYDLGEDAVGANSFTAMMWIKPSATPISQILVTNGRLIISLLKVGKIVAWSNTLSSTSISTPAVSILNNQMNFVAVSFNAGFLSIYVGNTTTTPSLKVSGLSGTRDEGISNLVIINRPDSVADQFIDCAYSVGAKGVLDLTAITEFYNETKTKV